MDKTPNCAKFAEHVFFFLPFSRSLVYVCYTIQNTRFNGVLRYFGCLGGMNGHTVLSYKYLNWVLEEAEHALETRMDAEHSPAAFTLFRSDPPCYSPHTQLHLSEQRWDIGQTMGNRKKKAMLDTCGCLGCCFLKASPWSHLELSPHINRCFQGKEKAQYLSSKRSKHAQSPN